MNNIKFDKHTGYFLKPEEKKLLRYIKPECFVYNALVKNKPLEKKILINLLQDELHDLINSFLNGGFSNKGFIFYPVIKDVSQENKERSLRILKIVNYLKNKGIEFKNFEKFNFKNINSKNIAFLISAIYKDVDSIDKDQKLVKKNIKVRKFVSSEYKEDLDYLKPVFNLKKFMNKKLLNNIIDFHVHGSIATNDYVKGFSDLDTLMILKKSAFEPKNLIKLRDILYKSRKFLYHIDSLQHHSYMIITEYDLDYYCQTYFPLELFKYSKSFTNNKKLNFKIRNSKIENISKFFWFVNYFRNLNFNKKEKMGCYSSKFLLHAITLFPTLYLQAKGIHIYKKYSFEKAKKDFPDYLWKPIEKVTIIRENWRIPKTLPFIKKININPLLFYQFNAKYWDIKKSILRENKLNQSELSAEMFKLSEKAWENIKNQYV